MGWTEAKTRSSPTPRPCPSPRAGALAQSRRSSASSQLSCRGTRRIWDDVANVATPAGWEGPRSRALLVKPLRKLTGNLIMTAMTAAEPSNQGQASARANQCFDRLAAPFRRELKFYCSRMLGWLHEAEALVQRTQQGVTMQFGFAGERFGESLKRLVCTRRSLPL